MLKKTLAVALTAVLLSFSVVPPAFADDPLIGAIRGRQERREGVGKAVKTTLRGTGGAALGYGTGVAVGKLGDFSTKTGGAVGAAIGGFFGLIWDWKANKNDEAQSDREMVVIRDREDYLRKQDHDWSVEDQKFAAKNLETKIRAEYDARLSESRADEARLKEIEADARAAAAEEQLSEERSERTTLQAQLTVVQQVPVSAAQQSAQVFVENCLKPRYAVIRGILSLSRVLVTLRPGENDIYHGQVGDTLTGLEGFGRIDGSGKFRWVPFEPGKIHPVEATDGTGKKIAGFQIK